MKTRELVFQYPDGSYPGLYRVGIIKDGLGSVDWSPATIDMSGNMQLPGNLDVSGSAVVDGTLTVGSTIYALSDVVVDGNLDVSGSLTVSSIETCGLSAAQGRFTVDCSYGYISILPNNGFPPGFTGGSFNETRIEMYCGITVQRSLLRLFAQERYDDNITEARIILVDSSGQYIAPAIQFDGSAGQLNIVSVDASKNTFTALAVDLAYGYLSLYPNLDMPPGDTGGSYEDSRIDMYCNDGGDQHRFRIISQTRYDSQIPEARLLFTDISNIIVVPVIQFDASAEQLRILNYNPNEEIAVAVNMSGQMAVGATWHEPNSRLTVIGRESIVLDTPPVGTTTGPILTCVYDPSYNSVACYQSLAIYPNQPAGTTAMYIISREYDTVSQNGAPLVLNPDIADIVSGSGNVGVGASINPQTTLDVGGTFRIDRNPPATSTAAGVTGQIAWDENYLYVCVASSSWARVGIAGGW